MEPLYSIQQVLDYFEGKGLKLSRAAFYKSHLPKLEAVGYARQVASNRWLFHQPEMTHWAEYAIEVRKRMADGRLPGNYEYDQWDCTAFINGLWDEEEA